MSSECLLEGKELAKSYTDTRTPSLVFLNALLPSLFGAPQSRSVLHGIDLKVNRGETVGIVGRNGAGKTTLLGLLGGVITPTAGTVKRHGKVATLLGLSAGFNANFTGRENTYLFCSIYNIPREHVEKVVSSVEEFAELGEYMDLPLRTYSSGMQARLSFACAVNVYADLIIIDETLAVGDASFKLRCYDKIKNMQAAGQSFLLVSHSQNLVANYCTRAVVLDHGKKVFDGNVLEALQIYKNLRASEEAARTQKYLLASSSPRAANHSSNGDLAIEAPVFALERATDRDRRAFVSLSLKTTRWIDNPRFSWGLRTAQGIIVASFSHDECAPLTAIGPGRVVKAKFSFDCLLKPGKYFFSLTIYELREDVPIMLSTFQNILSFDIPGTNAGGIVDLGLALTIEN